MKYRIPRPCECFKCGEKCYAVVWSKDANCKEKTKVFWRCSSCGRDFTTFESLEKIMIKVDEKPKPSLAWYEMLTE